MTTAVPNLRTHTVEGKPRRISRSLKVIAKHAAFAADVEEQSNLGRSEDQITENLGYKSRKDLRRQLERIGRRDIVLRFIAERGAEPVKDITKDMRSAS